MSLLGFVCIKSGSALLSPDRQMFRREKKAVFPFILLRLFDPEGPGAGTRRPLVPQEIEHLPLQSNKVSFEIMDSYIT
ncbi:hypothetical protein [Rossellomorea vietnamensis]|uniref:hypothetical protein n=1 Tax=Rossellomorea vietnamensis TaxID=218284 RepID=UPI003CF184D7